MVTPIIVILFAMTLIFVGIYRSMKANDVSTRAVFGWNLGLIWGLCFVAAGVLVQGTENVLGLTVIGAAITVLFVLGAIFIRRPQADTASDAD